MSRAAAGWRAGRRLAAAALALVAAAAAGDAGATPRLDLSGYVKSFAVVYDPAAQSGSAAPPPTGAVWALNNRARTVARATFLTWLEANAAYDLSVRIQDRDLAQLTLVPGQAQPSVYRVRDLAPVIWSDRAGDDDRALLLQNLDRLYAKLRGARFDLYVGRQAIAWGSAKAINPTDVIAPFLPTEIDTEDRVGVDAARMRIPLGALSELDLGYVAGRDLAWDRSAAFARARMYVRSTDLTLLSMVFRRNLLFGLDATRAVGGAGVWLEAAQVIVDDRADSPAVPLPGASDDDYFRLSAGADYNLRAGLYGFAEYHFNGAGAAEPRDYLGRLFTTGPTDGAVYQLGRHYAIPGVRWQVSALNTLSVQSLINLSDGSLLVTPYFEHSAGENLYLSLGAFIGIGEAPEAIAVPAGRRAPASDATVLPRFRSEYGAYPDSYYVFLR